MNKTTLLLAVIATACSSGPEFDGIAVNHQAVYDIIDYMGSHTTGHVTKALDPTWDGIYEFVSEPFDCSDTYGIAGQKCAGLTLYQPNEFPFKMEVAMIQYVGGQPTSDVRLTAVAHEAAHLWVGDPDHTRADIWGPNGAVLQYINGVAK